jgi:crotonobetaine/carnitine-CoA ligase
VTPEQETAPPPLGSTTLLTRLGEIARADPGRPLLAVGEESCTYGAMAVAVDRVAATLDDAGISVGRRVAIMSDDSVDAVAVWLGVNAIGAVDVPLNVEWRGSLLEYVLNDASPTTVYCSRPHLDRVTEALSRSPMNGEVTVQILGNNETSSLAQEHSSRQAGDARTAHRVAESGVRVDPSPGQLATIMYTSGTTGSSKGVMLPHGSYAWFGQLCGEYLHMSEDERVYCAQPLYHIDARIAFASAIMTGGSCALGRRFSAHRFWDEVRAANATRFFFIGTMLRLLDKQPRSKEDASQPARFALGSATPPEMQEEFEARFQVSLIECYGLTEAVVVLASRPGRSPAGSVGKPTSGFDVRIVDEEDQVVEPGGGTGEIVFRPAVPNVFFLGYWNQADATVTAWQNLWFHTGDLGRVGADLEWHFIGRKKDSIRRRGENVSAWEVEQAFTRHPAVLEAAAIGVPSALGDEDVAVLLVLRPGVTVPPEELCEFVGRDLAYFMVPRFVEFVPSLPKTPSERIVKGELRTRGVSRGAWDAERVGWKPARTQTP